jgi:hypothetical protein
MSENRDVFKLLMIWAVVVVVVSSSIGLHFYNHVNHEEEAPFSCKLE